MAPAQSKPVAIPITQYEGRKRKVSYKITDENFVGAESNAVTKRLKQAAAAAETARATAEKCKQRESSVEDDEDHTLSVNNLTKDPSVDRSVRSVRSADRSTRSVRSADTGRSVQRGDALMLDSGDLDKEDSDDDDNRPDVISKPVETAEKQRGE
jgi:hypothetical protein